MTGTVIDFFAVVAGIIFLTISLISARDILREHHSSRNGWFVLVGLIVLFILGYLYFAYTVLYTSVSFSNRLLSVILVGGGLFVLMSVNMSLNTIREISFIARRERSRALHDELTGLGNRSYLYENMGEILEGANAHNGEGIVLLMDLDRFKEINDTLGHHYGDELLRRIAPRLRGCVRAHDVVARVGGDEFAVVLPGATMQTAMKVINKVTNQVEQNYRIDGHSLDVELSIGVARYPVDGRTTEELLKKADVAMYMAKRTGANYAVYDVSIDDYSVRRLNMAAELRDAVRLNELQVYYQPKLDMKTASVTGMEALVRWQHPQHGFLEPGEFIHIAEQNGLINSLTRWVLQTALREFRQIYGLFHSIELSVNLSARNLQDETFPDIVRLYLEESGVPPERLILEITESSLMEDMEKASRVLQHLHDLNVKISIDDFGTGYSSLAHLKQLPISEIKIDKSFVGNMLEDENDAIIVRSTIDLAHNMGRRVTAEGVCNQDIYDLLEILGCDQVQGYYINQAVPMEAFRSLYAHTA